LIFSEIRAIRRHRVDRGAAPFDARWYGRDRPICAAALEPAPLRPFERGVRMGRLRAITGPDAAS